MNKNITTIYHNKANSNSNPASLVGSSLHRVCRCRVARVLLLLHEVMTSQPRRLTANGLAINQCGQIGNLMRPQPPRPRKPLRRWWQSIPREETQRQVRSVFWLGWDPVTCLGISGFKKAHMLPMRKLKLTAIERSYGLIAKR